ncbi:serine hydrolase domain-containing protein [Flavilitoribacter nigricans]|uniref:Beta-lactamase-related domain-containing protein n=1 Tax=Flavilitoribacter nigricans (strain ATCC 23147 / DSM 23189 / NBRC 102662 / NCIMB 1420 / SS-2) TaxID=1122177 RepID=A0A2D0N9W7_FLAN2|nr:serine hydrolase domain-containing protein [Flavilitoribacter nigricans]PHN04573.1 hypothetical protein CRP01_21450 [Flavilitoribacter nigricans DSM 23189 = NBRC 102662]
MITKKITPILSLLLIWGCTQKELPILSGTSCDNVISEANIEHPRHTDLQQLLQDLVRDGLPGIQMSIRQDGRNWNGSAGKADLAGGQDLLACDITRVGSTVKTFTALTVLMLQEEGKLTLNDPVRDYLSPAQLEGLENADEATIRQLLEHSSGIYNYILNLEFQTASLNDLTRVWQPEELLAYARGKSATFAPGSDVAYSNTNYILLGQLIEQIEGKAFYEIFREKISEPAGLEYTRFAATDPVPESIIRGYVDLYSKLEVIDATHYSGWDYFTADGGLIANAHDLALFMETLFTGSLLSDVSREEMLSWKRPSGSNFELFETDFGLGIFRMNTPYGAAYMHSGDAIGYYATMFYFPQQQTAIAWAVNGNYGKLDQFSQSREAMERVFKTVFEE